jgi:hypothetical protein
MFMLAAPCEALAQHGPASLFESLDNARDPEPAERATQGTQPMSLHIFGDGENEMEALLRPAKRDYEGHSSQRATQLIPVTTHQ